MKTFAACASLVLLGAALGRAASAQTAGVLPSLQVTDVDPTQESTLAAGDVVSVSILYASPRPVLFRLDPYWHAAPVPFGKRSRMPTYAAGHQHAFAWFTIDRPAEVDSLHIAMQDANTYNLLASAEVPVQLHFTGAPGATRPRALWAQQMQSYFDTLGTAAADSEQQQLDRAMPRGAQYLFFVLFIMLVLALVCLALGLPIYGIIRWRGGWRVAAGLPLLLMLADFFRIRSDTAMDPTSHNLAPFEMGMWAIASIVLMLALLVAKAIARGKSGRAFE